MKLQSTGHAIRVPGLEVPARGTATAGIPFLLHHLPSPRSQHLMMRLPHACMLSLLILAMFILIGCGTPASPPPAAQPEPQAQRVIGSLPTFDLPGMTVIRAPTTVQAGQSFTVTVTTYSSSSCVKSDGADVQMHDLTAEVTPWDLDLRGSAVCTADLAPHPRHVEIAFDRPGQATIRVVAQNEAGAPVVREQGVTVKAP